MKPLSILKSALFAGGMLLGASGIASASPLIEYQGTTFAGASNENAMLAKITVGGANVDVGGFGVFGQARSTTSLQWVIFDSTNLNTPLFKSGVQQVNASPTATWYDYSFGSSVTLQQNHTYAMGVLADKINTNGFLWGYKAFSYFGGNTPTAGTGLTLLHQDAMAQGGYCNTGWGPCSSNTLTSFGVAPYPKVTNFSDSANAKMSLRIQPVPEPAEWTMLIAGLLVVGFIARRRRELRFE
jgi:hypothetical protein